MVKRVVAAGRWIKDCLWMIPLVLALAGIDLLIAELAGPAWAAGWLLMLILLLCFNAGAHRKGPGETPSGSMRLDED